MMRLSGKGSVLSTVLILISLFLIHLCLERRLLTQPSSHEGHWEGHEKNTSVNHTAKNGERFLTYLPHSGLHNQRIALINSVILAKALNRTLIMPELNLGTATYWRPSDQLPYRLDECGDQYLTAHKKTKTADGKPWWSPNCFDYRRYLPMAVESIFDLTPVHELGVKTIQRRDMKLNYFERYWSVPMDERNKSMAYQIMDGSRYSYQIVEDSDFVDGDNGNDASSNKVTSKFVERYTLTQLGQCQETFMIFNSLFGSDRLALHSEKWVQAREYLRKEMGVRQPWVLNSSLDIVGRLGGPGSYLSVHIRMGDGIFKKMMEDTMERVRQQLIQRQLRNNHGNEPANQTIIHHIRSLHSQPENRLRACLQLQYHRHHHRLGLVYMTTDATSPLTTLPHLFEEFVCLFTLNDFRDVVDATLALQSPLIDHRHQQRQQQHGDDSQRNTTNKNNQDSIDSHVSSEDEREYDDHDNNYDSIPMLPSTAKGDIFLPLIDAEVASQASFFVPTPKSTFSGYIGYRNKRFRNLYIKSSKNDTTSLLL